MTIVYDNWERLVRAAVRKNEIWEMFHDHSRTPSNESASSETSTDSGGGHTTGDESRLVSPLAKSRLSTASISNPTVTREKSPLSSTSTDRDSNSNSSSSKSTKQRKSYGMRLDRWIWSRLRVSK